MAEDVIIKELLDNPFSVRQLRDKLRMANKCRPTSPLPSVITHHRLR